MRGSAPQDDNDHADDKEEYEVEAILDSNKDRFGEGKLGYLVKWKNYREAYNSWVTEEDTLYINYDSNRNSSDSYSKNATNAIALFWQRTKWQHEAAYPASKCTRTPDNAVRAAGSASTDDQPIKKTRHEEIETTRHIGNMVPHKDAPTWDALIHHIDRVERVGNMLYVYFTLYVCTSPLIKLILS
ncbi:hypothetical protein DFH07DRAFT_963511 [Mycena maculata]|uniref:Chromo domain-containing protein n=1 Tax=Mycena maculata TaxID=230809 RepID=A0AAD7IMY6_9AGAR|nr:hypothetical protein DFH07DRAFT_963511 [Mycena maculata]